MVNQSEHGVQRVVHHKDYYIRGGDMTVLVENHLYRVHSYFFERESLFFRQKLTGSANDGDERLGSSDLNAYTLDDVKSEDFARFLWVFYNPKYSLYDAPLEVWLSILHLANRWSFISVKDLTIRELERLEIEPVDKISIYHEYSINRAFLVPSYIAVCTRDKPLSFVEGSKLGMETVLRIADARERARQRAAESGIRSPTYEDFDEMEMESMVREVFGVGSRPASPITNGANGNGINGFSTTGQNGSSAARARSASPEPPKGIAHNAKMGSISSRLQDTAANAPPVNGAGAGAPKPPGPPPKPSVTTQAAPKIPPPAPDANAANVPTPASGATDPNKNGGTDGGSKGSFSSFWS
ncbi:hypothetical protein BJ138DRAFT_1090366 [Hygrophoropsis aurantiaca]|uniref:Uncharacterized protein n=1 Tax=Hygrophoropsis aurantiaca TaxID=72124 RepID=A0ACB8A797_9AGAM|nr:hypothetical protein BJ138DRAFT_1090366 [Hygrophoropsis aurantiaca]